MPGSRSYPRALWAARSAAPHSILASRLQPAWLAKAKPGPAAQKRLCEPGRSRVRLQSSATRSQKRPLVPTKRFSRSLGRRAFQRRQSRPLTWGTSRDAAGVSRGCRVAAASQDGSQTAPFGGCRGSGQSLGAARDERPRDLLIGAWDERSACGGPKKARPAGPQGVTRSAKALQAALASVGSALGSF